MKTVVVRSSARVSGSTVDCQVSLRDQLIDPTKQYRCSLRWFTCNTLLLQNMAMFIDGMVLHDHSGDLVFSPISVTDYTDLGGAWQVMHMPHNHQRIVTVSTSMLRFRITLASGQSIIPTDIGEWTLELQFFEL